MLVRFRLGETDDKGKQQLSKGKGRIRELFGGMKHKVQHLGRYGFVSHPPKEAIGMMLVLNGNPDQAFVIAIEHADSRMKDLAEGEVGMHDNQSQYIVIKRDKIVLMTDKPVEMTAGSKFTIKADEIILDGVVKLGGADASTAVSRQGTLDTAGHAEVSNLATKVFAK